MVAAPEITEPTSNGQQHGTSKPSQSPAPTTNGISESSASPQANGHAEPASEDGRAKEANLPPPEIARQIPCRFFPLGTCKYGEQCAFSHSIIPTMPSMAGPSSAANAQISGQNGARGSVDFSQSMQHSGIPMYYPPPTYDNMNEYGYPAQFSPPQGFYYPPQFAPYYGPPQAFYPPPSSSPSQAAAEQAPAQATSPSQSAQDQSAEPAAQTESSEAKATETEPVAAADAGETIESKERESGEAAAPVAGPSEPSTSAAAAVTEVPVLGDGSVPAFFPPMPMLPGAVPYYKMNGRAPNAAGYRGANGAGPSTRGMGSSKKGSQFLAPDGTRLPKPNCSFFEANRCRNKDNCTFPHLLADGTDARKLGLGMIGIDGRTDHPEEKGGMPPAWQQSRRQGPAQTNNTQENNGAGRSQGFTNREPRNPRGGRYDDNRTSTTSNNNHGSDSSRISLGRLPPGSSTPSLVAAINGLTRRIPPMQGSQHGRSQQNQRNQNQRQPQQRVPSGEDFPALASTEKGTAPGTPALNHSRESTHPSSPEIVAATPAKEPWSPEVGRDGAPSTEPSPPRHVENKASSESGESDFIIVTANEGGEAREATSDAQAAATTSTPPESVSASPAPAAAQPTTAAPAQRISFASAAAKAAAIPGPQVARSASKARAAPAAPAPTTANTAATSAAAPASAKETSTHKNSSTGGAKSYAKSTSSSPVASATSPAKKVEEDEEGFTVATRKERRSKNASKA